MNQKAFDMYAPAILQGAVAANPSIIHATPEQRQAFLQGCQNLLTDVLQLRDTLSQTSSPTPPTT